MSGLDEQTAERLEDLVLRRDLGTINASEQQELENLLCESSEARRAYLLLSHDAAALHEQAHEAVGALLEGDKPEFVEAGSAKIVRWWHVAGWAAAAALVLLFGFGSQDAEEAGPGVLVGDNAVAILAAASDAQWEGRSYLKGARLVPGELHLRSGYAQIEFYSGASVVLEGPARLTLREPMSCLLSEGRLHAQVPKVATGFVVGTPAGSVIDLGTEFGVLVSGGGMSEVHVATGLIEVRGDDGHLQQLTTGEAWQFSSGKAGEGIPARLHEFLGPKALAGMVQKDSARQLKRWRLMRDRLAGDAALMVYFDFEEQLPWERNLNNVAQAAVEDGAIVGAEWIQGRFPGKSALQLSQISDRIHLNVPGEYDAMTLAAWVRFDSFDHWLSSLLLTEQWSKGDVHWHTTWDGECILGIGQLGVKNPNHNFYTGPQVIGPEDRGRWLHLACTYDPVGREVRQYVDGQLVEREEILHPRKLRIGKAAIGNWAALERAKRDVRQVNGAIDEFLILSRAMSEAEIEGLYQAGSPDL